MWLDWMDNSFLISLNALESTCLTELQVWLQVKFSPRQQELQYVHRNASLKHNAFRTIPEYKYAYFGSTYFGI